MKHASQSSLVLVALVLVGTVGGCQALDEKNKPRAISKEIAEARQQAREVMAKASPRPVSNSAQDSTIKGTVLAEQGLYGEAVTQFERAIADNPLFVPAYVGAGNAHYKLGDLPKAEKNFGRAASIQPDNFDAQYMHGLVLQEMGRVDDSIRSYLKALVLKPSDFNTNLNIGTAYLQVEEAREALPFAQRAAEINPENGNARINLGVAYAVLGRHEDAITEWNQAAELTDLSPELLLNLADSYSKLQRHEEMVSTLDEVVKLKPTATAYERLGSGLFRLQQYDEALSAFVKGVELDPNHYPAHNGVGVTLLQRWLASGQQDGVARNEAFRALRRSLQIEKNQPKVLELLSRYRD